jgi:hypothetical protein
MRQWRVRINAPSVKFDGVVKAANVQRAMIKAMDMMGLDFFCPKSVGLVDTLHIEEWIELEQQELDYDTETEVLCFPA